jgi:hypothetical protein
MRRTALVAVLVVAAAVVAVPMAATAALDAGVGASNGGAAGEDAAPGARLAGVVGSQGAAISGALQNRSVGVALSKAGSPGAKAGVVATAYGNLSERLDRLRERKADLMARHENGSIRGGEYRARLAHLAAEIRATERVATRTSAAAKDLPEQALAERGVSVENLTTLRRNAANMTGPEVAAVARNVTGNSSGPPFGVGEGRLPGGPRGESPDGENATADGPEANETESAPGRSG